MASAWSYGCAGLVAPPESDAVAVRQVARWTQHNLELKQLKGLFRIRLTTADRTLNLKAALAAKLPGHLRVELLNPVGQPLLSLAADGHNIHVVSVSDQKFYRLEQSPDALEPFIHVPIGVEALLDTLSGRPPLPEYAAAQSVEEPEGVKTIVFKDRWYNRVAALQLDAEGRPARLQRYAVSGGPQYEIQWLAWRTHEGYLFPDRIQVTAASGEQVLWTMQRLWTIVDIPPATFVLPPPQKP